MSEQEQEVEVQNAEQQDSPEDIARASRMGWVAKDQFRGDPNKWKPAKEFLERGEREIPILRERLHKMETEYAHMSNTLKRFNENHEKALATAREQAIAETKRQQAEAVALGDKDAFLAADRKLEELRREEQRPTQQQEPQQVTFTPEFLEWKAQNQWVESDPEMYQYALAQGAYLDRTKPHLKADTRAFLAEVRKRVEKEFPHKFGNPQRSAPSSVEGDSRAAPAKRGKYTYSDLPPEAKQACDRYVKQGLMNKETYLKHYFGE